MLAYQNKPSVHNRFSKIFGLNFLKLKVRTICVTNFVDGKNMPEKDAYSLGGPARVSEFELRVNPLDEVAWK